MEADKYNRRPNGTFGSGNHANDAGRRPKDQTTTYFLRQKLPPEELANLIVAKVKGGNEALLKTIIEYYDGKPINKILEGKLDIVESEEWEELISGLWGIAEGIPELKQKVYELLRRLDTTGRSCGLCDDDTGEDAGQVEGAGQGTVEGAEITSETDSMSVSPPMGKVERDSVQGTTQSEVSQEAVDTDSVPDGEAEPGAIPKDI